MLRRTWLSPFSISPPSWCFFDGEGGGDGGGSGGGGAAGDSGAGDAGAGAGDGDLGDAGKKAISDERDARRKADKAAKDAAKRAETAEAELAKFREGQQSETEKALDQARKDADKAARDDVTRTANRRIVTAEVKAAAGTKLADPADAVKLLDLDEFEVDGEGEVDTAAIAKAIDKLIDDKPYLKAGANARFQGGADQGKGGGGTSGDDVRPGIGRLRQAYAESSKSK